MVVQEPEPAVEKESEPAPIEERPRRHTKPRLVRDGDGPFTTLVAGAGRADGLEVADVVHAVTDACGLDGEAVRDVRVLERFSLFAVPDAEAARIVDAVAGTSVNGATLSLQPLRPEPVPG